MTTTRVPRRVSRRRRWRVAPVVLGCLILLVWGLSRLAPVTTAPVEDILMDSGPSVPPCPILLRLAERERRCDNEPIQLPGEKVGVVLLSPKWSPDCRLLLRDHKDRFVPFNLTATGDGTARGFLGPFKRQAEPYILSFVAIDERRNVEDSCGAYQDVRLELTYPLPEDTDPATKAPKEGER